jgi:hypothetical protein
MSFLIQDKEVFYCCLVASERHRITPPLGDTERGFFLLEVLLLSSQQSGD